jgi:copper homeostasis protein (lipoprotein)
VLFHLDQDGDRVTGELSESYQLQKNMTDFDLEEKKWILTELNGVEMTANEGQREAFIEFNMETGRFSSNNTCNNFLGQYEIQEGNGITFGQTASTMMACPDMNTENTFMEALSKADSYTILDNVLSLNKARMAPLARFRVLE